jgi:hypothetical protein
MASIPTIFLGVFFIQWFSVNFLQENVTLTCQRVQLTEGSCQLVHHHLLGIDKTTMPLSQVKSAKVDVHVFSGGDTNEVIASGHTSTYRVVLLTYTGKIPFNRTWSSGTKEKQENVDQINAFISNPGETSLRVQQGNPWFTYTFAQIFILAGGWALGSLCVPEKVEKETIENR